MWLPDTLFIFFQLIVSGTNRVPLWRMCLFVLACGTSNYRVRSFLAILFFRVWLFFPVCLGKSHTLIFSVLTLFLWKLLGLGNLFFYVLRSGKLICSSLAKFILLVHIRVVQPCVIIPALSFSSAAYSIYAIYSVYTLSSFV